MTHKQIHDVQELKKHINKLVKLSTIDGQFFEGILGHVDEQNIHIVVPINIGNNHIGNIGNDHLEDHEQHQENEVTGREYDNSYRSPDVNDGNAPLNNGEGYGIPHVGRYQTGVGPGYPPTYGNPYYYGYPPQSRGWNNTRYTIPTTSYYGYLTLPTASLSEVTEPTL